MPKLSSAAEHLKAILAGGLFAAGLSGSASATEWIFCSDGRSTIDLGLLLGLDDAITIAGATLKHGSNTYTTNSVYGEGELFRLRILSTDKRNLRADIVAANDGKPFGNIHLSKVSRGQSSSYRGKLTLAGEGRWNMSCDGE